ncbi:MAG: D-aminoacylase [Nitrososphaeria archaeon]
MFDIIVRGGKVVDGTGNPWFKADIGIKDGKIVELGRLEKEKADTVIDARGNVVSPGFVDMHSHSDLTLFINPKLESTIHQGITTLVVGNCGISLAPINKKHEHLLERYIAPFLPPGASIRFQWSTFEDYLRHENKQDLSSNVAHLVGHGTVRVAVMGFQDRAPSDVELEHMKYLVAEAMEAGAFGMSTGLIYPPGIFSGTGELVEVAKVVSKYGGLYSSHVRGESSNLIYSIEEAIEIGEKSGVSVQISHHKVAGRQQIGKSVETLKLMEDARKRGVDVACDQYPYEAGMTSLATLLPPWVHEGGIDQLLERIKRLEDRVKIRDDIEKDTTGWENIINENGWENIYISNVKTEKNKDLQGKNIQEAARMMGKPDELTALLDLLVEEEGSGTMVVFVTKEEDVCKILSNPLTMVGTDSWSTSPEGVLSAGKPHPRFYGTYPRILREYVRERSILSLEEAVRKMTSFPAQRLRLWGRGVIRENMWADIVVFNPDTIMDTATYQNPHQYPEGIEYVIVNGEIVIDKRQQTQNYPGRVLRHKFPKKTFPHDGRISLKGFEEVFSSQKDRDRLTL